MSTFAAAEVAEFPGSPVYVAPQMAPPQDPPPAPKPLSQKFGERLARRRAQLGWTQEQAAQNIGVTHRTYQRWEEGKGMPYERNQELIASRMEIAIEVLLGGPNARAVEQGTDREVLLAIMERLARIEEGQLLLAQALLPLEEADEDVRRFFEGQEQNGSLDAGEEPEDPEAAQG